MTSKERPFLKEVDAWTIWFRAVGSELANAPAGLTSQEVARLTMPAQGLNSEDAASLKAQSLRMGKLLADFSTWGLVSGSVVKREEAVPEVQSSPSAAGGGICQIPKIPAPPVQVAILQKRGERLLRAPKWRQQLFFAGRLVADFKFWKPLQLALSVAGGLVTVLKMVLLWESQHVVIVAGLGGALAFVLQFVRARGA